MRLTQWEHPAGKEERAQRPFQAGWELWGCGDWVWGRSEGLANKEAKCGGEESTGRKR